MRKILCLMGSLGLALWIAAAPAAAQTPSPDAMAAARELVATMKVDEQFKAIVPSLMAALKPAIVQGRADVARDYDSFAPLLLNEFQKRLDDMRDAIAAVYANNLSVDEMRAIAGFYKTPAGQKILQKMPVITQQSMAAGQQLGRTIGAEVQQKMIEELRKKGHAI